MRKPETLQLSSKANPRAKQLMAALDVSGAKRECTLLVGEKLVREWLESTYVDARARLSPVRWLRLEGQKMGPLERELQLETWELSEKLMAAISGSPSPPGLALVMELGTEPTVPVADLAIVPWGIQDPGNLGAMLRSAAAFGFQDALLGPGCADPFSPKALRGSMGAAFALRIRCFSVSHFSDGRWMALDSRPGAAPISEADLSPPLRLMAGNEGHGWQGSGLPAECARVSIPTIGVESLNAAVAVGIACFEAAKRSGVLK
ncbi:MAG: RNA methyltransferase [Holophagales bacterium]|jgi:TrmH family RNA methyltransferase|nr:RNA methyltransferase [Holophagales bacterium]